MLIMQSLLGGLETGMLFLDRFAGFFFLCCCGITMWGLKGFGGIIDDLLTKKAVFHHRPILKYGL